MPGVRTSMRKIREVLRLRESGLTVAEIARSLGSAAGTAWTYATRLNAAGLTWPLPPELDDAALERLVYPPPPHSRVRRPEPDWPAIHRELKRPRVMLLLVWEEYRAAHPDGYGYSRFSLPFSPPLFSGRIFGSLPRRGDVAVFKYPRDNSTDYIKRIVGLPGELWA